MKKKHFTRTMKALVAQACLLGITQLAQAQNKVVAYVPNWVNLNTYSNQIDYAKLTHINIAFENPVNSAGDLSFNTTNNVLINKAHSNNLKVLISIGGGSASGDATLLARYASLTNNTNRAAFVAKLAAYVTAHNFDGLDVDLEGPNINGDYGAFIAALSGALKPQGKLLTAALSQGYGGGSVPNSVFQYFDFVNIMAYDGAGYWDPNSPGQHSSLDFAKSNTQYWLNRGLPKSKAVLGVPFYGYGFGSAFRNRDYPYNEIIASYPGAENQDQVGSTIWYNGIPTIKAKTNYAFDQGIAGIMIWSLDYDGTGSKSLLTAIDQVFKARTNVVTVPQSPYSGSPIAVPGKVQAENYDLGGQGVSYNDIDAANQGGAYRTDWVDIQATTDTDGGYNVGYIADGEWLEYTVNVAATGPYNIAFRTASAGGTVRLEVDGSDVTGPVTLPVTGAYQTWATTTKNNVTLTAGQHVFRVFVVTGGFNLNFIDVTAVPQVQAPYNNTVAAIPGKFEAENYDLGGEGLAYHDIDVANQGGAYRTDGVDVQATTDAGAGYNVSYVADGEWLEYTVNVATTGLYDFGFRTAGTGAGALRLEVDGADVTGAVTIAATGAWQTWATTTKTNVSLTAGQHILRVFAVTGGFNLNYVTATAVPVQAPYNNTIVSLPGKFEAENYDLGGQGLAYNDIDAANQGGAYRTDGVDVQATTDAGGGYNVAYIATGEWLEYTVNVATAGLYDFGFRTASAGGALRLEVDGSDVTGPVTLPVTGAYQTWATTTKTNVSLTAGQHILRVFVVTGGFNLNYVTATAVPVQSPYNNTIVSLPGKFEAENYDLGGEGISFHDIDAVNQGNSYRTDGVDLEATTDAGAGYNLAYTAAGEWLEYTVNVAATDAYNIAFRTASAGGTLRLEVDGSDVTGPVTLPVTGAYQTWATTTKNNITLTAGQHVLRVFVVTGGFNLNYVEVTVVPPVVQAPFNNTIVALPGKFEAENYDLGGQGLAYNDIDTANQGGAYRTDAVDIQVTTDAGAGYNVAYIADGEWLEYTVNVTTAGTYNVGFRTAGTGAGALRLEVDGTDATGTVAIPATGAWQTWTTVTKTGVALTAGQHIFRVFIVTGGFNLNYVTVSVPVAPGPGFLRASGKNIVNNSGNFVIKAMNLGNYMVQEGYMLNLGGGYQHNIKAKIADVVGAAAADKFYDDYHANFITKADIDTIAKWGFNAIRLPIHYNLFTPLGQPDVFLDKGFTMVDNIVSWCKANNIYVIIDLHAAPGGQSSGDISDYVSGQPSLWESQANRDQTVKLWRKIAERYANEEYVGGYDLINETNWTLANNNALLAQLMKSITTAIRQVDNNHILFIEGNSYANDYNGLTPKWDNNMAYSFHKYWNDNTDASLNFVFAIRDGQNVPIWMGEFGENSNHWIAESVSLMNKYNIGWAVWPYKKMGSISGASSFKEPANWSALAGYINGGAKPSAATGQAILNELIENIKAKNNTSNKGYVYALISQPGNNNTVPFANVTLPGKITAAHYDIGKQGYAYSDAVFQTAQYGSGGGTYTDWNTGWYYRNDGVDLQFSAAENGPTVGWTADNEWLQYTVNVSSAGQYSLKVRVAGNGGKLSLAVDGTTLINGATIAATGAWTTWQTVTLGNVNLTAGTHKLKFTITTAGYNISNFEFTKNASAKLEDISNAVPTVLVVPNPSSSFVKVLIDGDESVAHTIQLIDIYGHEVLRKENFHSNEELDITALVSAMYLVLIDGSQGGKLVKE